jgi:hypothetical protein
VDEEAIFAAALGNASPAERRAFLAEACAGDAKLRAGVEALLLAHDNPDSFLEPRGAERAVTAEEQPLRERPGTVIGPYKLMEQIGEGGMGTESAPALNFKNALPRACSLPGNGRGLARFWPAWKRIRPGRRGSR